jgi:hypothetical protein
MPDTPSQAPLILAARLHAELERRLHRNDGALARPRRQLRDLCAVARQGDAQPCSGPPGAGR